ncbi:MAG: type IV toxin-antitoxin system AbiEi family antitoxin domain-containing protein [Bacilli bacterium]|nr:type IV toxin-antitoxin system AbiEi family antitoxin domain-containing protein [Bacilli bacterium]
MKKKVDNLDTIFNLMKEHNGYITSGMLDSLGIHRMYLQMLIKKNYIRKVDKGIYVDVNVVNDKLYALSLRNDHFIYSHFTALYLHHYVNNIKGEYDITVTNDYHNPTLKNNNIFYVSDDNYLIGKKKIKTNHGNYVLCYDLERTICDIIRSKRRFQENDIIRVINKYLKSKDCNIKKLYKYAKKLNIYNEVLKWLNRE